MGGVAGVMYVVNDGAPGCLVHGPFTLEFLDAHGAVALQATAFDVDQGRDQSDESRPGWARAGRVVVHWNGFWCERARPLVEARVIYDGRIFTAAYGPWSGGSACGTAAVSGQLAVTPFGPAPTPAPTPQPAVLRARIEAPDRARAGETLAYRVTLTNVSAETFSLDPCPFYVEWLGGRPTATASPPPGYDFAAKPWHGEITYAGVAKESYSLNCGPVGSIGAGSSVTFEMRLRVPSDASGADTLRWSLGNLAEIAAAPLVFEAR
ncbi:MAG: hypothetical protein ABR525_10035 [Candidatus Limnocylindria bacterium]